MGHIHVPSKPSLQFFIHRFFAVILVSRSDIRKW